MITQKAHGEGTMRGGPEQKHDLTVNTGEVPHQCPQTPTICRPHDLTCTLRGPKGAQAGEPLAIETGRIHLTGPKPSDHFGTGLPEARTSQVGSQRSQTSKQDHRGPCETQWPSTVTSILTLMILPLTQEMPQSVGCKNELPGQAGNCILPSWHRLVLLRCCTGQCI